MTRRFHIQPVEDARRSQGLRVLLAGAADRSGIPAHVDAFDAAVRRGGRRTHLWWALDQDTPVAAAMTVISPGRSALLYYSPPAARGVRPDALLAVIAAISHHTLACGAAFVQGMTKRPQDGRLLVDAGYRPLAELASMQLDLPTPPADDLPCQHRLRWRCVDQLARGELQRVVAATYEGSLDCPGLIGLRSADDLVAGHRASGTFVPQTWWVVDDRAEPAGCCLLNDSTLDASARVVYLGVVPSCRGRQIGRAMIRHAAHVSKRRGRHALTLAVDERNTYARDAYVREGFRVTESRTAYILAADRPAKQAT